MGGSGSWEDGDKVWNIQRFGVPSMILMGIAKAYSQIPPDKMKELSYLEKNVAMLPAIASASLDQSFLSGMSTGITAFTEGGPALDRWMINTSKALSAIVYPNTLAQISQTFTDDNYIREVKNMYDRDRRFEEQIKNTFKDRMFMGKDLPTKVSIWGENVLRVPDGRAWPYMFFDVSKQTKYQKSSFGVQMFEFYERYKYIDETVAKEILPSLPSATNQVGWDKRNMTPKEVEELQVNVGKTRRMYVEYLMSSSEWEAMSDEERIESLGKIYRESAAKVKAQMFMFDTLKDSRELWDYMVKNDLVPVPTRSVSIDVGKEKVKLNDEEIGEYYDIVQRHFVDKNEDVELKDVDADNKKSVERLKERYSNKWQRSRDIAEREMRQMLKEKQLKAKEKSKLN
jgi:PHD/YefM family antitoxin component YafN of YafNO toxin-antitoxin module